MSKAGCLPSFIWLQWFDNFTLGTLPSYNLQHGVRAIKMMILPAMFSQLCEQYLAALLLPLPRGSSACRVFLGSMFLWLLRSDAITNAPCNQFYKCCFVSIQIALPFKVTETRWEALGSIAWLSHGSSRKPECSLGREVFEWKVWWPYWTCFARSNLHDLPGHWFWLPWLELQVFLMYTIYICIV